MKFNIYHNNKNNFSLVEAGVLNASFLEEKNNYKRCTPFRIAGELGWDIVLPHDYVINWNGGEDKTAISIKSEDKENFIFSTFGHGILTIQIPYLFELEKNTFLWVKGPNNHPLSMDMYPCEGVVEADWYPSVISIDYKIVSKNVDIFLKKGSPYCRILPYPKHYIEKFNPIYKTLNEDPEFKDKRNAYDMANKFFPFSEYFLRCYENGIVGNTEHDHIPKINLNLPENEKDVAKKCPFHKMLK